jgi:seryl-tRNA synthetase
MIDIQYIRDNPAVVKQKTAEKGFTVDIDRLLAVDEQRREQLTRVELLREERNQISSSMKGGKPAPELIERGKRIKEELSELEPALEVLLAEFDALMRAVPNPAADDVPLGDETASVEILQYGAQKTGAKDHLDFAEARGWVDFERGAKVAGAKFYYVKGDLALLENAAYQYALNLVVQKGFTFMTVPHMVNSRVAAGTGFAPRTSDQGDEYFIEGEDLTLVATAEASLTGLHADEILNEKDLPLFYAGYSPCYRKEAGTYGKHTRGLFRVHQFNKLEMYAYCLPEQSVEIHEKLRGIEEEIWQAIGIPYHIINIAAGDLGTPAAKKYDIEYWSPVDGIYRELTSCSNCTDFQARNLNIRVRRHDGTITYAHTLNGTAVSLARTLVAIIENFQNDDGSLTVPQVLRPYLGGREKL